MVSLVVPNDIARTQLYKTIEIKKITFNRISQERWTMKDFD
jgi:hypothetical protein